MKSSVLTVLLALAAAGVSLADTVNYDTITSYFTCTNQAGLTGCNTYQVTIGTVTGPNPDAVVLTYVGSKVSNLNTPSITNFGRVLVSCFNGGTSCGMETLAGLGVGLTIQINQTDVDGTGETFVGAIPTASITGQFSGSSGFALLNWGKGNAVESNGTNPVTSQPYNFDVTYSVLNNLLGLVVPASDNCSSNPCEVPGPAGETSIQGQISLQAVPEPASFLLLASGLIGIGARRRK